MNSKNKKGKPISRRKIIPLMGTGLLLPLLGFGNSKEFNLPEDTDEEYHTLLKPDGTPVRVKVSTVKKSKIVKKNVSNKSLLNWLSKKL